jgi:hypothetical protein
VKIILLNGPPGCGKDTIARFLLDYLRAMGKPVHWLRMSHPIKRAFAGFVNAPIDEFGTVGDGWEANKDQQSSLLDGKTYRQWQIDFSEKFMKPLYGDDVFGRVFAADLADRPVEYVLVPDCGFHVEAEAIWRYLPEAMTMLIRVMRPGHDFSNDSRSYIFPKCVGISGELINDDTLEILNAKSLALLKWRDP